MAEGADADLASLMALAEPAAEAPPEDAPVVQPKKRSRWSGPVAQPAAQTEPTQVAMQLGQGINPALMQMAPALSSLFNRTDRAGAPPAGDSAVDALRRVHTMLGVGFGAARSEAVSSNQAVASNKETLEININDCRNKGMLTKKATQDDIQTTCNVSVRIGGRYKPPGDTSTDDQPLHLKVEADTPEDLVAAEEMIREMMGPNVSGTNEARTTTKTRCLLVARPAMWPSMMCSSTTYPARRSCVKPRL